MERRRRWGGGVEAARPAGCFVDLRKTWLPREERERRTQSRRRKRGPSAPRDEQLVVDGRRAAAVTPRPYTPSRTAHLRIPKAAGAATAPATPAPRTFLERHAGDGARYSPRWLPPASARRREGETSPKERKKKSKELKKHPQSARLPAKRRAPAAVAAAAARAPPKPRSAAPRSERLGRANASVRWETSPLPGDHLTRAWNGPSVVRWRRPPPHSARRAAAAAPCAPEPDSPAAAAAAAAADDPVPASPRSATRAGRLERLTSSGDAAAKLDRVIEAARARSQTAVRRAAPGSGACGPDGLPRRQRPRATWRDLMPVPVAASRESTNVALQRLLSYDTVSRLHGFLTQQDLRQLEKETGYSRRELYVIFVRFKALCSMSASPEGVDSETFRRGVARLAVEDSRFTDAIFALVDADGSGAIEIDEFLTAMSALERGSPAAKNAFCLQAYDVDGDGRVGRDDLATMFISSSMLKPDATTREVTDTFVDSVFATLGVTEKGHIELEDINRYMETHEVEDDVWALFGRSMLKDFGNAR